MKLGDHGRTLRETHPLPAPAALGEPETAPSHAHSIRVARRNCIYSTLSSEGYQHRLKPCLRHQRRKRILPHWMYVNPPLLLVLAAQSPHDYYPWCWQQHLLPDPPEPRTAHHLCRAT